MPEFYFKIEGILIASDLYPGVQKMMYNILEKIDEIKLANVTHTETAMMANDQKMEYDV
jgi:hypothetical protein